MRVVQVGGSPVANRGRGLADIFSMKRHGAIRLRWDLVAECANRQKNMEMYVKRRLVLYMCSLSHMCVDTMCCISRHRS
jgi:hypothetical protein